VAAGIGRHYGIDPVLVRLGFVATTFLGGLGAIAYLVGWIALPLAPPTGGPTRAGAQHGKDWRQLLGYALVALGLLIVPGRFGFSYHGDGIFWPVALIALGAAVLWLRTRAADAPRADPPPERGPGATGGGGGPDDPGPPPGSPDAPAPPGPGAVALLALPAAAAGPPPPPDPVAPTGPAEPTARSEAVAPSPRAVPRSPLAAVTVSALLVLVGTAWLLDAIGAVDVDLGVVAASALTLLGIALLVSAWYGRARRLIVLGIPLLLVVAALGLVDVPLRGGIGDPSYAPHRLADVRSTYELAVGDLTVDLRGVDFSGVDRTVRAQLGIGRLNVVVPPGVRVVVDGHSGVGDVVAFGDATKQCCPTDVHRIRRGAPGDGTLHLVARVGAGHVEVKTEEDLRATS
jgi:hypothetical protein